MPLHSLASRRLPLHLQGLPGLLFAGHRVSEDFEVLSLVKVFSGSLIYCFFGGAFLSLMLLSVILLSMRHSVPSSGFRWFLKYLEEAFFVLDVSVLQRGFVVFVLRHSGMS